MAKATRNGKVLAAGISRRLFGGVLEEKGKGFLPALELFTLIEGTRLQAEDDEECNRLVLPDETEHLKYVRRSHDFIRRLVWDPDSVEVEANSFLLDSDSRETMRALFESLAVPMGTRKSVQWKNSYFQPYVRELIHYDVATRGSKLSVERVNFRGSGALVHKILRSDPNKERLQRIRKLLVNLYPTDAGPVGRLAAAMHAHDTAQPKTHEDDNEVQARLFGDVWEERLIAGFENILSHESLAPAARIQALMHWVAFSLIRMQLARARTRIGRDHEDFLIVDMGQLPGQLRRESTRSLKAALSDIGLAMESEARNVREGATAEGETSAGEDADPQDSWHRAFRNFFSGTAAAIGFLNAPSGKRHFTLKLDLLQTLVLAALPPGKRELTFEEFCSDVLYGEWGLVLNSRTAADAGLLDKLNGSIFDKNAESLAKELRHIDLLTEYSDHTRMIHA